MSIYTTTDGHQFAYKEDADEHQKYIDRMEYIDKLMSQKCKLNVDFKKRKVMRQIFRFGETFIITLAAYALLMMFGVGGILGRIYVSTLLVLMCCILGDVACYLTNKLPVSKYDVSSDLLGVGVAFVVLLII